MNCNCINPNNPSIPKNTNSVINKVSNAGKWAFSVIHAWGNYILGDESKKHLAMSRATFCKSCDYAQIEPLLKIIPDSEIPEIEGRICKKCHCPLSAKLRSNQNCPLNLW